MQKAHGSYGYPLEEYVDVNFDHVRFIEVVPPKVNDQVGFPESAWRIEVTFADGKSATYVVGPGSMDQDAVNTELAKLRHKIGSVQSGLFADVSLPVLPEN